MHESTRFIKVRVEAVLPVPFEVRESLDAVAEAGLEMLKGVVATNVTTVIPGTITGSWQSMPSSWRPRATPKQVLVIEEEVTAGFTHTVDSEDRIGFVEDGVVHPWDDGLWIFPADHPYRDVEKIYRTNYLNPRFKGDKPQLKQEMSERLELEAGEDDDA
jgi:hypothetical protein